MQVDDTTLEKRRPPGRLHIFVIFYFQYSHQGENRGETYEVLVAIC